MWRVLVFFLLTPIYTAVAWAVYFGAKLVAAAIGADRNDQPFMAVMAVVILCVVVWALITAKD